MNARAALLLVTVLGGACASAGSQGGGDDGLAEALTHAGPEIVPHPPRGRYLARGPASTQIAVHEIAYASFATHTRLSVAAPAQHRLRRAHLAPGDARPCGGGETARAIWLADQRRWDRPLAWTGAHELRLEFGVRPAALRAPTVLDLAFEVDGGEEVCLRTSVAPLPAGRHWVRRHRASPGGSIALNWPARALDDRPELRQTGFTLGTSVGAWLGYWRLGGRADVCFLSCSATAIVNLPISASAEHLLWVGRRLSLGLGLGYQLGRVEDIYYLFGDHRTWVHGPRASLLVLGGRPLLGSHPHEGFGARGFELFLVRRFYTVFPAGVEPGAAWIFGVGVAAL